MKQLSRLILLIISWPFFATSQSKVEGIKWIDSPSWEKVREEALKENKFIFVDAYTTWCIPCKLMDRGVFSDKQVGDFMNKNFLSVKVQMDQTANDNESIRSWYSDANYINETYKPDGYPCFLFFAPNGIIANKSMGFQKADKFIELAKASLLNPQEKYETELKIFNKGQLGFSSMPSLARLAKKNKNNELATRIAKEYKSKYLDHLSDDAAFTQENLFFIVEFAYTLLNTEDKYFKFLYSHGEMADKIIHGNSSGYFDNYSQRVVTGIIKKDEITNKLFINGKPVTGVKPDWDRIYSSIAKKFGKVYAEKYFPNEQIKFYEAARDWNNYVKFVNRKIKLYPPGNGNGRFGGQFGDAWGLNSYAWSLFQYCDDKKYLKKALRWSDLSIKLSKDSLSAIQYLDTKANLLYRIGKVDQAIELEQKVILLLPEESTLRKEYNHVIKNMKQGLPTWPTKE